MNSVTAFAYRKITVQIVCNIVCYYEVIPLFLMKLLFIYLGKGGVYHFEQHEQSYCETKGSE
jgi:hypothetical protein